MKCLVYKATCPKGRIYIGITKLNLEERKRRHLRASENGSQFKFHKVLRKYPTDVKWEVLEEVSSWEKAQEKEIFYIEQYNSFYKGLNSTKGGEGQLGNTPFLGKKHKKSSKDKIRKAHLGKPKSKEARKKMSLAHKGKTLSQDHIRKCLEARGVKPFKVLDKESNVIGVFVNQSSCARELGLNRNMIAHCLNMPNIYKTHKGYRFQYA